MWHDLVHMGVSPWEKGLRTAVVYLALLLLIRLAGKRQLAQLTAFDLVVLLLLSNVVQNAIIGADDSLVGGLLGAAILVVGNHLLVRSAFLHPRLAWLLQGSGTDLVRDGEVVEPALRRQLITRAELDAVARRQGVNGLDHAESVVLEPEGTLTVVPREEPGIAEVLERLERIERKLA